MADLYETFPGGRVHFSKKPKVSASERERERECIMPTPQSCFSLYPLQSKAGEKATMVVTVSSEAVAVAGTASNALMFKGMANNYK